MKDAHEPGRSRLADALREVKNRAADRDDVVVELREATRARLDLLAEELAPVFREVPEEVDIFDFAISSGLQPRLWIDGVAHVALGRDRRTFRFVRDTRAGRVVLAESSAMPPITEAVTRYVAERLVERERALDGQAVAVLSAAEAGRSLKRNGKERAEPQAPAASSIAMRVLSNLALLAAGALLALLVFAMLYPDRIATLWPA